MILPSCNRIARRVIKDRYQPPRQCRPNFIFCFFVRGSWIKDAGSDCQIHVVWDDRKVRWLVGQCEISFHEIEDLVEEWVRHAEADKDHGASGEQCPDDLAWQGSEYCVRRR